MVEGGLPFGRRQFLGASLFALGAGCLSASCSVTEVPEKHTVEDCVSEWWTTPLAVHDSASRRTVGTGISSETSGGLASLIVWEVSDSERDIRRFEFGTAPVDYHNVPSVLCLPDGRVMVSWNHHNADNTHRYKVTGRDGGIRILRSAEEYHFESGVPISYSQLYLAPVSPSVNEFVVWQLSRYHSGDGWAWEWLQVFVDFISGSVSFGEKYRFHSGGTSQMYAMSVPEGDGRRVRVAAGFNPAEESSEIYGFEVDLASGDVRNV